MSVADQIESLETKKRIEARVEELGLQLGWWEEYLSPMTWKPGYYYQPTEELPWLVIHPDGVSASECKTRREARAEWNKLRKEWLG